MTDRRRTELIDRYRSGRMSPVEESQFHEELLRDTRLRRMLNADELINGSIRSDLASVATNHAVTEARVMATLAASTDGARHGLPGDSLPPGTGFLYGSSTVIKTLLAVVVVGGLGAGIYGLWPHSDPEQPVAPVEHMQAPVIPQAVLDDSMPSKWVPAIGETTGTEESAVRSQSDVRSVPQEVVPHRSRQKETAPEQPAHLEPPATVESTTKQVPRDIPIRKKDSVHLKIDVKKE